MLKEWIKTEKGRITATYVAIILISLLILNPIMTNPGTHRGSLDVIDRNKMKATTLSVTVTVASTALSMMPDDTAAPIADELSELSTPLMIITCVLFFEQFMLTTMEHVAFAWLIPIAMAFRLASVYSRKKSMLIASNKMIMIAIVCACVIPFSAMVTNMVENSFAESINRVNQSINEMSQAFEMIINGNEEGDILSFVSNVVSGIGSLLSFAKEALGLLIDAVAILIITSCVIPALTAILFIWCIKSIITSRMENFEDIAMNVLKRLPLKKKKGETNKTESSLPA